MAANLLTAPDENYLSPKETIARLQKEFAKLSINKKEGRKQSLDEIRILRDWKRRGVRTEYDIDTEIEKLKSAADEAYYVLITDDPNSETAYLTTLIRPNAPLFFGYRSAAHQDASLPLLKRCAAVLGYDIED